MLEKTREEVSDDEKREIFSELEKEKDLITENEGEFKKSSYLKKVNSRHESLLLRKYLQQIFRTVKERKLSE